MAENTLTLKGQEALDLSGFDSGDTVVLRIQGKVTAWSGEKDDEGNYSVTLKIASVEVEDAKNFKDAVRRSVREIKVTPRIEPQVG